MDKGSDKRGGGEIVNGKHLSKDFLVLVCWSLDLAGHFAFFDLEFI